MLAVVEGEPAGEEIAGQTVCDASTCAGKEGLARRWRRDVLTCNSEWSEARRLHRDDSPAAIASKRAATNVAPAAKKPAAKNPATKKRTAKKPAAKKPAVKKPAAKRPVAKKPTAKKPAAKTATKSGRRAR